MSPLKAMTTTFKNLRSSAGFQGTGVARLDEINSREVRRRHARIRTLSFKASGRPHHRTNPNRSHFLTSEGGRRNAPNRAHLDRRRIHARSAKRGRTSLSIERLQRLSVRLVSHRTLARKAHLKSPMDGWLSEHRREGSSDMGIIDRATKRLSSAGEVRVHTQGVMSGESRISSTIASRVILSTNHLVFVNTRRMPSAVALTWRAHWRRDVTSHHGSMAATRLRPNSG